jgi:hypothetical protein
VCVYQKVTLATFDVLTAIVSSLFSAHPGSFDRLGVNYPGAGLRVSLQANSKTFPDYSIDALPGTIDAPFSEIVVDGRPSREVVGKHASLAATS